MSQYDPTLPDHLNDPIERELAYVQSTLAAFLRGQFSLPSLPEQEREIEQLLGEARMASNDNIRHSRLADAGVTAVLAAYRVVVDSKIDDDDLSLDSIFLSVVSAARSLGDHPDLPTAPEVSGARPREDVKTLIDFAAHAIAAAAL